MLRVLMVSEMPRVIRRLITKGKTHRCADAQVRKVRINVRHEGAEGVQFSNFVANTSFSDNKLQILTWSKI